MPDQTKRQQGPLLWLAGRSRRFWIVTLLLLLPALYVVSFGPACWLCNNRYLDGEIAWLIYRPITWLVVRGPAPIRRAIWWWEGVFELSPGDRPSPPIMIEFQVLYPDVRWL
jgi:hypothetical protein